MESSASLEKTIPFRVLIVAGGSGSRLGGDIPKQYQELGGISVLEQSIITFYSCPGLKELRLVCDPEHVKWYHDTVQTHQIPDPARCGKTRKDSVYNGLKTFLNVSSDDIILVHDAARPFITRPLIEELVKAVNNSGAATLAVPVADTLARETPNSSNDSPSLQGEGRGEGNAPATEPGPSLHERGRSNQEKRPTLGLTIDRSNIWSIQTPQGFRYGLLMEAHNRFLDDSSFTDDASLITALGHPVTIVCGDRYNFKITTQDDLELGRKIMARTERTETRTGFGFDVHTFTDHGQNPAVIRLGGVDIPHEKRLSGHSDADVGLHALTDAILATIAAGDIGTHFPPSDPRWKGADSSVFLAHAARLLREKQGEITLLDLTFLCEAPKIGPFRDKMQEKIAKIAGITPDRVSIKATTTEKLGFTGRGEGIAAQALATVRFP